MHGHALMPWLLEVEDAGGADVVEKSYSRYL
jgi:hypothetical protein